MLPAWKRARGYITYEAKSVPRYHPCSTQRPSTHVRLIMGQRAPQGCKRPSVLAAPLQSQIEKRRREAARKPSVAAASREYTLYRAPKHMKVRVAPTSKVSRAAWVGGLRSLPPAAAAAPRQPVWQPSAHGVKREIPVASSKTLCEPEPKRRKACRCAPCSGARRRRRDECHDHHYSLP